MWKAILATIFIAGCGFPRPADVKNKSLPIGGIVHGLWRGADGVALRLTADGVDTLYTVTANGHFTFSSTLDEGVSYATTIVSNPTKHTCVINSSANGVVGPNGVASLDVACAGPGVSIDLSAPIQWSFDPTLDVQPTLDASLLLQDVAVTVRDTSDLLISAAVSGSAVSLGQPSPAQALVLGMNVMDVDVAAQGGLSMTYHVVIDRGASVIAQATYGKASNTDPLDIFGKSIAVDGDTLVVGASGEASRATGVNGDQIDNGASSAGAVYVFQRTGAKWVQQAYLKASNTEIFDDFGVSVAISGDTIAVGAFGEDSSSTGVNGDQLNNTASFSGAVYVFHRTGGTWTQQAYIKASNTGSQDGFGVAVALSKDTLAVGAYAEASPATGVGGSQGDGASGAGAVYVFQRTGTIWEQQTYIKASNTQAGDSFGHTLALDGDTLAVGAPFEDSSAIGINGNQADEGASNAGAVYVFVRTGVTWAQQAYIKASNTGHDDMFGSSVALSKDTLAVGAPGEASAATGINGNQTDNNSVNAGAVYIFQRVNVTWAQQAYIKASNTKAADEFGFSVALSKDNLVVGAHLESNGSKGVDGNQTDGGASASGAAYLFQRSDESWSQKAYLKASNTGENDQFGCSVAISNDTLVVAAFGEGSSATGFDGDESNNNANGSGAIYIFR